MVYFGGKPSTGCEKCRARKIKCDQTPGGCTNCQRRGYECPGYRNEVDLKFRDESHHVARKSRDQEASRRKASASRSPLPGSSAASSTSAEPSGRAISLSESSHPGRNSSLMVERTRDGAGSTSFKNVEVLPDPALSGMLTPDLEDHALTFFFSNHVIGDWHSSYGANINSYGMDDALFSTVKAIGLAGISGFAHASKLNIEARRRYLAAIQNVNNAIVFPESAKRDSTLMSIMLLSQIEAIECFTSRSWTAWENHVKGATAVLKLRGAEKLKTPLEIRLFVQAASGLVICCLRNRIHLPEHLMELTEIAGRYMNPDAPGWRYFHTLMLVVQFAADVEHNVITDPYAIIQRALELHEMQSLIFLDAGPEWQHDTIYDDTRPDIILLGYYYKYKNFLSAQIWNSARSIGITIHEIIRTTLLKGFAAKPPLFSSTEYTAQFQTSTDLLYELQNELLASLPQHFLVPPGSTDTTFKFPWSNFESVVVYSPSRTSSPVSEKIPLIRSIGGYLLPWMLYRTANVSITKRETAHSLLRLLKLTGSEMGIQMAFVLADELEAKLSAESGT